jgi:hypothetical protein
MEAVLLTHLIHINIVLKLGTPLDHPLLQHEIKVLVASNFLIVKQTLALGHRHLPGPPKAWRLSGRMQHGHYEFAAVH